MTVPTPIEWHERHEVGDFGVGAHCRGGQRIAGATYASVGPSPSPSVSDIAEDMADVGSFGEHGSVVDHAQPAAEEASDVGATGSSQERPR